jgi:hypothetical protein
MSESPCRTVEVCPPPQAGPDELAIDLAACGPETEARDDRRPLPVLPAPKPKGGKKARG